MPLVLISKNICFKIDSSIFLLLFSSFRGFSGFLREKHQLIASHMCPNQGSNPQPEYVHGLESNLWPFCAQNHIQPTEPHWQGLTLFLRQIFNSITSSNWKKNGILIRIVLNLSINFLSSILSMCYLLKSSLWYYSHIVIVFFT